MSLPTGVSGETQNKKDYISLSVDRDGYFYFDKKKMEIDELHQTLVQVHQADPDAKVFVRGDREAIHGNVIRLLNIVRSAGFYKMAFEIKSEAAKGVPSPN